MKKILSFCLCAVLLLGLAVPAFAAETTAVVNYGQVKIVVDGATIVPKDANGKDVEPFIYNGTTYLPVRSVANALGLGVDWVSGTVVLTTGADRTAVIGNPYVSTEEKTIAMGGSDVKVTLDGVTLDLKDAAGRPVTPIVSEGVTYLPVRAIADALSVPVLWDGETATVYLGKAIEWKLAKTVNINSVGDRTDFTETYDGAGRLLTLDYKHTDSTGTSGYRYTYTYDRMGNVLKEVYVSNYPGAAYTTTDTYTYDSNGLCLTYTHSSKSDDYDYQYTERYQYDANGVRRSMTNEERGEYHAYSYDAQGNLISDRESIDGYPYCETVYTYDARGNCLTKTTYDDPDGELLWQYTYTYDARGNKLSERYECFMEGYRSSEEERHTYDEWGNETSSRYIWYDENGDVESDTGSSLTRDMFGHVLENATYSDGEVTGKYTYQYSYNDANQAVSGVCTYSDGGRVFETFQYDAYGNLIRTDYSGGGYTAFEYAAIEKH